MYSSIRFGGVNFSHLDVTVMSYGLLTGCRIGESNAADDGPVAITHKGPEKDSPAKSMDFLGGGKSSDVLSGRKSIDILNSRRPSVSNLNRVFTNNRVNSEASLLRKSSYSLGPAPVNALFSSIVNQQADGWAELDVRIFHGMQIREIANNN